MRFMTLLYGNTVSDSGFIKSGFSNVGVWPNSVERCADVPTEDFGVFEPGVGIEVVEAER